MKHIIIIGGGIIGLSSAYYLHKEGHQVTVIDQSNMDAGASYVNAGYLSPSHIIPLSAPGVMKKGLKWMFNSASPLYIKPRLDLDFLQWTFAFNKSCNAIHVNKAIPAIKEISLLSQDLYEDIHKTEGFKSQYDKKGLLMLCQTEKMLEEEVKLAHLAKQEGLDVIEINREDLQVLEPNVEIEAKGATYFKCDSHSTPGEFMEEMITYLKNVGVSFYPNEKVEDLEVTNGKITAIKTDKQKLEADEFVLAAGSWSALLSKKLGLKLLLQAGKGYRINCTQNTGISIPAILAEAKAAVTPMHGFTRFAGTMELAGINDNINPKRVKAISKSVSNYYQGLSLTKEEEATADFGLRPCSPDGLPYIGRTHKYKNLIIASGHAMMGWSLGPPTGKLVSEIISDKKLSLDIKPFHPDRKF